MTGFLLGTRQGEHVGETNAGTELLKLMDSWKKSGSITEARRTSARDVEGLWEGQHAAVRYLAEVEAFLEAQADADEYRSLVMQLRKFVFASSVNWDQSGLKLDSRDRTLLVLASRLMSTTALSTVLAPVQVDALRDAIQKSLDVLDADPRQVQEGANYLRYLLHRCLDILGGEDVDLLALRHLSFEATGVAVTVATELPDDRREAFSDSFRTISGVWFSGATAGAAGNLLSSAATGIAGLLGS